MGLYRATTSEADDSEVGDPGRLGIRATRTNGTLRSMYGRELAGREYITVVAHADVLARM